MGVIHATRMCPSELSIGVSWSENLVAGGQVGVLRDGPVDGPSWRVEQ